LLEMVLVLVPVATAMLIGAWPAMCGSVGEGGGFCHGAMSPMRGFPVSCLSSGFQSAFKARGAGARAALGLAV
ncbi:hypothetical protein ABTF88_20655, partial [Acinetobacter baumannii]